MISADGWSLFAVINNTEEHTIGHTNNGLYKQVVFVRAVFFILFISIDNSLAKAYELFPKQEQIYREMFKRTTRWFNGFVCLRFIFHYIYGISILTKTNFP